MAEHNPQNTVGSWSGIPFQGEMDGEMYTVEHNEDRNSLHVGSKGFATIVRNANESGVATVMLSMKSPTNRLLTAAYAANTKGPFLLKDLSDTTLAFGEDAVIQKHSPIKRGKDVVGMEWKFLIPKLLLVAGGDQ